MTIDELDQYMLPIGYRSSSIYVDTNLVKNQNDLHLLRMARLVLIYSVFGENKLVFFFVDNKTN
jgi:hypothetical protein